MGVKLVYHLHHNHILFLGTLNHAVLLRAPAFTRVQFSNRAGNRRTVTIMLPSMSSRSSAAASSSWASANQCAPPTSRLAPPEAEASPSTCCPVASSTESTCTRALVPRESLDSYITCAAFRLVVLVHACANPVRSRFSISNIPVAAPDIADRVFPILSVWKRSV